MAKIKNKFIVINRKHLDDPRVVPTAVKSKFDIALAELSKYIPDNRYWTVNQDEPYADKVIMTILQGEDIKEADMKCGKASGILMRL